ncbi:hypothetical protein N9B06_00380 [bacterium]|nr:hypothetical protein [bacterium]
MGEPSKLQGRKLAQALFEPMKQQLWAEAGSMLREDQAPYGSVRSPDEVFAEAACEVERIILGHAVEGWQSDEEAQKKMSRDIDDYLFALQRQAEVDLALSQVDDFIERAITIAKECLVDGS